MKSPLEYWMLAHAQQVGIVLETNNRQGMIAKLYEARKTALAQHPELAELSVCVSPTNETELWIVHKTVKVEDAS